ncbi:hypothetical protein JYT31_03230 [Beggiatoa alba]|nr:hypothetical protein [Beggiatoa alba]
MSPTAIIFNVIWGGAFLVSIPDRRIVSALFFLFVFAVSSEETLASETGKGFKLGWDGMSDDFVFIFEQADINNDKTTTVINLQSAFGNGCIN